MKRLIILALAISTVGALGQTIPTTPNFGLQLIPDGYPAWGVPYRATMNTIDSLVAPLASPHFTGTFTLPTSLNGCLFATSGVVSATGSACGAGGSVSSVFGRTGAVTATSGDYSFSQISGLMNFATQGTGLVPVANGGTGTSSPALVQGTNVIITGSWPNQTINATASAQVYPAAGVAVSTGSAWGSSLTAPSGALVGTTDTQTLTNKTVDGVTPTTFGFLDPTSSVQTQLNAKGTVTHTAGALTATHCAIGNGAADITVDPGCTTDGAGNLTVASVSTNGTTPGKFSLVAGTGSIPTLPANSAGLAAPATGGTAWLGKLPATITAGILHFGTPGTVDGVNESAITSSLVSLTADVTGALPNANLANPSTTVNGVTCTLGGTCTITATASASAFATLTDSSSVTWAAGAVALANATLTMVHTTSTRALNITGMTSGTNGVLVIKQDSTGGAALTLGTGCTWYIGGSSGFVASTTPTLTTTANAINILAFTYDGANCYANVR